MTLARLRNVGCAVTTLGLLVTAGGPSRADETTCTLAPLRPATQTAFPLLYSPRHDELTLEVGYVGSSAPVKSAVESTLMYSFAPDDQQWHIGVRAGVTAGTWASDDRGPVGLGLGLRIGWDMLRPMKGVLALYGFVQADALLLARDGDAALRPAAGLGLRAARMIGIEAGFEPLVSLSGRSSFDGGFGVGLSFDLCALGECDESAPVQTDVDLTALLYAAAADVATLAQKVPARHTALCAAVEGALDAKAHPPNPSDPADTAAVFLEAIVADISDPGLKAALQSLVEQHARYRAKLLESRNAAGARARLLPPGQLLHDHCIYAPFPVEIRTQLGCS